MAAGAMRGLGGVGALIRRAVFVGRTHSAGTIVPFGACGGPAAGLGPDATGAGDVHDPGIRVDDVVASLGKSLEYERTAAKGSEAVLDQLEKEIETQLGTKWSALKKLAEVVPKQHATRRRSFILLYAHLLRLPIESASLRKG